MAKSGASKGAKNVKSFDEQDTKLAMGKKIIRIPSVTPLEQYKSGKRLDEQVRKEKYGYWEQGKHI